MDEPTKDPVAFRLEFAFPTEPFGYTVEHVPEPPRLLAALTDLLHEVWRRITRTDETVTIDFDVGLPPSAPGPSFTLSDSGTYTFTITRRDS